MRDHVIARVVVSLLLAAGVAFAAGQSGARATRGVPLPASQARSWHAPFESGECGTCHVRNDARSPGALLKSADALCADCHDEISVRSSSFRHPAERSGCVDCHSPHNAARASLLY